MIWYRIRRTLEKAAKALRSRYHGSFIDRTFGGFFRLLRSPFRWAGRFAEKAGYLLDDLSSFNFSRTSRKLDKLGGQIGKEVKGSPLGRVFGIILLPITLVGRLLGKLLRGFGKVLASETPSLVPEVVARKQAKWVISLRAWWLRRNMGAWLKATPAIAALGGWIFLAVLVLLQTPAKVEAKYTKWADDAQKMGNFPRARVSSERLIQLGGTNQPANILRLAKSLAAMGFMDESMALADTVASQSVGYTPARLFIAEAIVNNPGANSNALRSAEHHLLRAYQAAPDSAEAQVLLGRFYYRVGDWEEAKWYLKRAFPQRNDAALTLAAIELNLRNELAAVRWAAAASAHYRALTLENSRNWRNRLFWAEAELIRGNYTNTLDILEEGIQRSDTKVFHRMSASIYADLLKRSLATDPTNIVEHLDLAKKGLSHDALNEFLLQHTVRLTHATPVADSARTFLRELTRAKENRALINFFQGMDAFMRSDMGNARVFFDAAFATDPENVVIANNYAWTLAISEPPDPTRSLKMINDVIQKYPQAPVFRETRGQIYARLGQWQDAAGDLENALPYFKSNAVFHASLAKVYSQLGKSDLSAEHQRIAEALKAAVVKK